MAEIGARIVAETVSRSDELFWAGIDGRSFTYGCIWGNARRVSVMLEQQYGLVPGDVVVPSFGNDVSHVVLLLAALQRGFVLCPLAQDIPAAVREELIAFVAPKVVLTSPVHVDPTVRWNAGDENAAPDTGRPYLLAVTSGSTGRPKAICHSAENIFGSALAFGRLSGFSSETRLYHVLPMTYMAGIVNSLLAVFMCGGTVIEGARFSAVEALNFWERPLATGANTLSLVPLIAAGLMATTRDRNTIDAVTRSIRHIQSTSAPIPAGLRADFLSRFGLPLRDCYGITEVGGPVTLQSEEDALTLNERGNAAPPYEIEIRETEGSPTLWIRSPFMMLGYRDGDRYQLPVDERGFFDTGDTATYSLGALTITGRKKDIIIRGGINVSPRRIESLLSTVAKVKDVAVLGVESPFVGERIVAFVETVDESPALRRGVHAAAEAYLARHEIPDEFVFLPALPRLFNGKIDKRRLREGHDGASTRIGT